jgi:D-alanyl-D-alanine dipeptidase
MRPIASFFLFLLSCAALLSSCTGDYDPSAGEFVDIKTYAPTIEVDLPYATEHNFFKHRFYTSNRCLVRREVMEKLRAVESDLQDRGLGLKVWDGYRPLSVQREFWRVMPDERYVSNPAKGSRHNRGAAVDVTLVDLKSGKEVEMPTGFDDFTPKAAADYAGASETAKKNRALLQEVMTKHGFQIFPSEWWHFDSAGWEKFPIEDFKVQEGGSSQKFEENTEQRPIDQPHRNPLERFGDF